MIFFHGLDGPRPAADSDARWLPEHDMMSDAPVACAARLGAALA